MCILYIAMQTRTNPKQISAHNGSKMRFLGLKPLRDFLYRKRNVWEIGVLGFSRHSHEFISIT